MSRRRAHALIAVVWLAAAALMALPLLWPAYGRIVGSRLAQDYELIAEGVLLGWWTKDLVGRCGRRAA